MQSSLKLTHAAKIMRAGIYEALNRSSRVSLLGFLFLVKSNTHIHTHTLVHANTPAIQCTNKVVQPAQVLFNFYNSTQTNVTMTAASWNLGIYFNGLMWSVKKTKPSRMTEDNKWIMIMTSKKGSIDALHWLIYPNSNFPNLIWIWSESDLNLI